MAAILDDKSEHCIPFILDRIRAHRQQHGDNGRPFFLGLNGVQGAGKTTLVTTLCATLRSPPHSLPTAVLSIDDLYLPHAAQQTLARTHPSNPLIQHRGQPSTHDLALGASVFASLASKQPTAIPSYDKSQHAGAGDRAPPDTWVKVNQPNEAPIEVVVFEGWCVGFRALSDAELERKWAEAKARAAQDGAGYDGQLARHELAHLKFVNDKLREYDALTDMLDAFVHIDAEQTTYVYDWRLQQEAALRASKGTGMTDEQVIHFVNGYYPAYELYTDRLRAGIFDGEKGRQLRLVVGKDRRVKSVEKL
ncbi:P-loop containing nucleoside triphosphate hydrolase protein [Macrophomina phaseolina]|uniref:P-loop containing nucleoside triphosphate hydrolase protein n=1 Tax=Macrophomina phaseolina TaxID=35725 RepID=A0ABQ8GE25_9PEZI|nr:P-loop containing nucleoside triphosphate hydrolase protein [Macrophomina phaseolina]